MTEAIDVLLIDPSVADARKTLAAIRRTKPNLSTVHVHSIDQAERLMCEQGLYTKAPQIPSLVIIDLPALGDQAKEAMLRLQSRCRSAAVPTVIFSARRTAKDIVDGHFVGAHMNVQKAADEALYAAAVERIVRMWVTGSFFLGESEAC